MVCVYCAGKTRVVNSRHQVKSNQVWRRRKCLVCGAIFTSEEVVAFELSWMVFYGNGTFKPFSRDKLFLSLYKCLEHRQDPQSDAQGLTDTIINKLLASTAPDAPSTLTCHAITLVSQVALNRFDTVAAVRYVSLHPGLKGFTAKELAAIKL